MKTLFIDSSRKSLSVALACDDKLVFVSNIDSYSKHSNFLMNEINNILIKFNLKSYDIDNYVVLNGPGSFTGIRVGVTISKTLAWVLSKKIYTLNNLEALSVDIINDIVISIIPDKDDYSYVGIYGKSKDVGYLSINDDKFNFSNRNITLVSLEKNNYLKTLFDKLSLNNKVNIKILDNYNYMKIIDYATKEPSINPHSVKPIYLKKIDVEKK